MIQKQKSFLFSCSKINSFASIKCIPSNKFLFFILFIFLSYSNAFSNYKSNKSLPSSISTSDELIALNGAWEFYWNELLYPQDFKLGTPKHQRILVPGKWNKLDKNQSPLGYGTYRKVIANTIHNETLGVRVYKIHSAYNLWINGMLIAKKGVVGKTLMEASPKNATLISAFESKADSIEILLQVSNFDHKNGGIIKQIEIGPYDLLLKEFIRKLALTLIVIGFVFFMAIYHFILFYYHKHQKSYLLFGIFCLVVSFQIFFASDDLFLYIFTKTSWALSYKLEYLTLYFALPIYGEFAHSLFNDFSKRIIRSISFFSALLVTLVLLTPSRIFSYSLQFFEVLALYGIIYLIYATLRAIKQKTANAQIMLAAFIILGLTAIIQILSNEFFNEGLEPIPLGFSIFILMQAVLLAKKSSLASHKLNLQSIELIKHRDHLNNLVKERTLKIEKQNKKIFEQHNSLFNQHQQMQIQSKQITDSINYARNIQNAALPSEKYIESVLPESFVFFKPKDIVSGDFYWLKKIKNHIVIVCADCTGHGVPGAFMSMLGVSILNDLVNKKEITQANMVLNELRTYIKESLNQINSNVSLKDGIDMSICVIDINNKQMQFAGAYNSLIYFKGDELGIIKGDRMPVGIHHNDSKSFTNNLIDIEIGDQFYLQTDGYIDQFGGENGKKYMQSRFIDALTNIRLSETQTQKQDLGINFDAWKGVEEQIDDVLVMGFKITKSLLK